MPPPDPDDAAPTVRDRLPATSPRWRVLLAGAVIALAALAVYANSLSAPFVFDDLTGIVRNTSIRRLWPLQSVLVPDPTRGTAVSGRPLVNLSLAVNYALGGLDVRGYHAFNLLIHALAGLALFGVVRRTLTLPAWRTRCGPAALPLAFGAALLWTVHPVQTESVSCVIQRTELLVGLCYLLTLYCFIRGAECRLAGGISSQIRGRLWPTLSFGACLAGMASKEVMITAPVLVLLYDRTFVAGSFREAWRRRGGFHLALAGTLLLLGLLVAGTGGTRGTAAGFGLGVSWWSYLLRQCEAVLLYLKLSVWPHPLVLDYGTAVGNRFADVWWLAALLVATVWSVVRKPAVGFLGACFFVILAPSSSVVPLVTQTVAEHRVYLPLAAVTGLAVAGLHTLARRQAVLVAVALAVGLGGLTLRRNDDYRSAIAIWRDTVAKAPANPRAHYNLGNALFHAGQFAAAVGPYETALRLKPRDAAVLANLAGALLRAGRSEEAFARYTEAAAVEPRAPDIQIKWADALAQLRRFAQAVPHYEAAVRLEPNAADAHLKLANALFELDRLADAAPHYEATLRLAPGQPEAHANLGIALAQSGRMAEALAHFESAVRLEPANPVVQTNLAGALAFFDRTAEARQHLEQALRLKPDHAPARDLLRQLPAAGPPLRPPGK